MIVKTAFRQTVLVVVVFLALAIKCLLVFLTYGTNDMLSWQGFLQKITAEGGLQLYRDVPLFNHPPFMIHLLTLWGELARLAHFPLQFSLRLSSAAADVGTACLIYKLAATDLLPSGGFQLVAAILAPVSLLVAGFHGNTDPLMMFFIVAAVYLAETRRPAWWIGLALGAAMDIKVAAVLMVAPLCFWLDGIRNRILFFAGILLSFGTGSLPYMIFEPKLIVQRVFGYGSLVGQWGWTLPARLAAQRLGFSDAIFLVANIERFCLLLGILLLFAWLNLTRPKPRPFVQCGFCFFFFLAASPGWGIQYLDWLVVWTVILSRRLAIAFHVTTGIFLVAVYTFWAGGIPWYLADSFKFHKRPWHVVFLGNLVWMLVVFLTYKYFELVRPGHGRVMRTAAGCDNSQLSYDERVNGGTARI